MDEASLFFKLPQIWAKIKGDLGEFDRDFRACVVLSSPGHLLRAKDRVWHHTQRHHSGRTSDKHTCAHDACARGRFTLSVRTVSIDIFQCSPAVALAKQRTSLLLILEEGERERGLDFWGNFLWREDLFVEEKTRGIRIPKDIFYRNKYRSDFHGKCWIRSELEDESGIRNLWKIESIFYCIKREIVRNKNRRILNEGDWAFFFFRKIIRQVLIERII